MRKVIVLLVALALVGCGEVDRGIAGLTGSAESCIDGVKYLQFTSGVTVKYNPDGTVAQCR